MSVNSLGPSLPGAVLLLKMDAVASSWVIRRQRGNITRYSPFKSNGNGQERLILLVSFKKVYLKKGLPPTGGGSAPSPTNVATCTGHKRAVVACVCALPKIRDTENLSLAMKRVIYILSSENLKIRAAE